MNFLYVILPESMLLRSAVYVFSLSSRLWEVPPPPPVSEWDVLEKSDKKSVYEYKISIEYIEKIVSLCEEQGCNLLFIKLPAYATGEVNHGNGEELQRLWNGFYDYADDNYLTYINFYFFPDRIFAVLYHAKESAIYLAIDQQLLFLHELESQICFIACLFDIYHLCQWSAD